MAVDLLYLFYVRENMCNLLKFGEEINDIHRKYRCRIEENVVFIRPLAVPIRNDEVRNSHTDPCMLSVSSKLSRGQRYKYEFRFPWVLLVHFTLVLFPFNLSFLMLLPSVRD